MSFPCPKCNRNIRQSGEVTINDGEGNSVTLPEFQCEECIRTVEMFGEKYEAALTFLVVGGKAVDADLGPLKF